MDFKHAQSHAEVTEDTTSCHPFVSCRTTIAESKARNEMCCSHTGQHRSRREFLYCLKSSSSGDNTRLFSSHLCGIRLQSAPPMCYLVILSVVLIDCDGMQLAAWGPCSATCGVGRQTRTASCMTTPLGLFTNFSRVCRAIIAPKRSS